MAKIDINTLKAYCEYGTKSVFDDLLKDVYPESIRFNMELWERGYEAAMNSVLQFLALLEQQDENTYN